MQNKKYEYYPVPAEITSEVQSMASSMQCTVAEAFEVILKVGIMSVKDDEFNKFLEHAYTKRMRDAAQI